MVTGIILLLGFLVSIMSIIFKTNNTLINKYVLKLHLFIFFLVLLDILLSIFKGWSYRGQYTDRIIFSFWFATGISLYGLNFYNNFHKLVKAYFGLYFSIPLLFLIFWFVPRMHFFAAVFGLSLILDGNITRYSAIKDIQLQESSQGMLSSIYPMLDIVEAKGLFEKVNRQIIYRPEASIDSIRTFLVAPDSLKITIFTKDTSMIYSDTTITLRDIKEN